MTAGADRRLGATLLLTGTLPFALAPAVHGVGGLDVPCPFLEATGVPCPLCGGTRAVALAAQGDSAFLQYGAVWVVVLAAIALVGVASLAGRRVTVRHPVLAALGTAAVAWAWAIAHTGPISS